MPRGGRREGAGRPKGTSRPPEDREPSWVTLFVRVPGAMADQIRSRAAERRITAAALLREIAAKWLGE